MTRKTVFAFILSLLLITAAAGAAQARDRHHPNRYGPGPGPGEHCRGPAYGWWDPGTVYGYGYWYGYGYGWWDCGPDRSVFGSTLSMGEAKKLVQWIIRFNPDLKVGDVTNVGDSYEVTVVTRKSKSLVDTLMVEKDTGWVYSVPRE